MAKVVYRSVDENDWILFYSAVVLWHSYRWSSFVDRHLPYPAERETEFSTIVFTDLIIQESRPSRQIPVWSYNLILFASFIWCSSITNYIALGILAYLSQHRFITSKERVFLFSLQSISFLLQYPRFPVSHSQIGRYRLVLHSIFSSRLALCLFQPLRHPFSQLALRSLVVRFHFRALRVIPSAVGSSARVRHARPASPALLEAF